MGEFFRGEVLTGQPPFDVELIALGHMRPFGMNMKKSRADRGSITPKNVVLEPPLFRFFLIHHPTRNEKLGKVTDFGDPDLNIEQAALDKSPGM